MHSPGMELFLPCPLMAVIFMVLDISLSSMILGLEYNIFSVSCQRKHDICILCHHVDVPSMLHQGKILFFCDFDYHLDFFSQFEYFLVINFT